jgi:hypothetical protein
MKNNLFESLRGMYENASEDNLKYELDSLFSTAQTSKNLDNIGQILDIANNRKYDWVIDYQIKGGKTMRRLIDEGKY